MSDQNRNHSDGLSPNARDDFDLSPGSNTDSAENEINLKKLSVALWRHKWVVVGTIILFGLLAGIIAFTSTPVYQSEGSILIYQPQSELSNLASKGGELGKLVSGNNRIGLGMTVNNELEVLRSRQLSLKIADSLRKKRITPNGRQYPVLFRSYPDDSAMVSQDTVAIRLQDKLGFKKSGSGADVIVVSYQSPSAVAAGGVVNIALSQFNKVYSLRKGSSANSTATFLKKEKARIKDSLNTTEKALRRFMIYHKPGQADASDSTVALARLRRDVKINSELFEAISRQYAETSIQERSPFGLGRVIESGYTPRKPQKPNKALYILYGLIVGGILGVGYVFIDVVFFNTIKGTERITKMPVPLLAAIPVMDEHIREHHNGAATVEVDEQPVATSLVTLLAPDAAISEPFRTLENNLIYAGDAAPTSVGITSCTQGEGKTTTLANLGVVLAEAGHKVILVDTDFRRPNLHRMFGLTDSPGITDILSDDARLQEGIRSTCAPGVSLLASGNRPANIAAAAKNQALLNLLKDLENHFDFVLVDTAPFGAVTEAAQILKQLDGVAVAAKFSVITEAKLRQTLTKLLRINIKVLGTVLTAYDYTKSNDVHPASEYYEN